MQTNRGAGVVDSRCRARSVAVWHAANMSNHGDASGDTPGAGAMLARGAGYGSLFGGLCGIFIAPVSEAVTSHDGRFVPSTFLLAVFTAPVAACYGVVAGLGAATAVSLLPPQRRTRAARAGHRPWSDRRSWP